MKSMIEIEKPIIPKFVADFIEIFSEFNEREFVIKIKKQQQRCFDFALWIGTTEDAMFKILVARKIGYEVIFGTQRMYEIPLKKLMTINGERQYLTKHNGNYFAYKQEENLKQLFTEKELREEVPKEYVGMAVLFDEKKED